MVLLVAGLTICLFYSGEGVNYIFNFRVFFLSANLCAKVFRGHGCLSWYRCLGLTRGNLFGIYYGRSFQRSTG